MENKREEMVLNIASKLDAITSSNGEITKLAIEIVENKNDAASRWNYVNVYPFLPVMNQNRLYKCLSH